VIGANRGGSLLAILPVLVVCVLLPLATFLISAWLLGWQLLSVQSGSMAPTYPVGSLLVVGSIDASQVEPGMALVFDDPQVPGRVVTHRVVDTVAGDELRFWTRGDANLARDPLPVPAGNVRGRVLWAVPHLGSIATLVSWPWSFVCLVLIPMVLIVSGELRSRFRIQQSAPDASSPRAW